MSSRHRVMVQLAVILFIINHFRDELIELIEHLPEC